MKTTTLLVGTTIAAMAIASWTASIAIKKSGEVTAHSRAQQAERQQAEKRVAQLKDELEVLGQRLDHKNASGARDTQGGTKADRGGAQNHGLSEPIAGVLQPSASHSNSDVETNAHDDRGGNHENPAREDHPTREETAALLDDVFYSEGYDTPWAGRTEEKLHRMFTEVNPSGSHLMDAGCRSTLCRIEVYHEDTDAEEGFIKAFATSGTFVNDDKQGFYHPIADAHGNRRTLFFYAREGRELPRAGAQ